MATRELGIDYLSLTVKNAAGHEHRIETLTRRALDIVAERLPTRLRTGAEIESLALAPINLPLGAMSDDEAAAQIADAILEALTLKLCI